MKPDELWFLQICASRLSKELKVRGIVNEPGFPINHKRAMFILEKWCRKNWYEYGVTLDLGWMTPLGLAKAKELSS